MQPRTTKAQDVVRGVGLGFLFLRQNEEKKVGPYMLLTLLYLWELIANADLKITSAKLLNGGLTHCMGIFKTKKLVVC